MTCSLPSTTVLPCVRSSRLAQSSMTPGAMMSRTAWWYSLLIWRRRRYRVRISVRVIRDDCGVEEGDGGLPLREQRRKASGQGSGEAALAMPRPHPLPEDERTSWGARAMDALLFVKQRFVSD